MSKKENSKQSESDNTTYEGVIAKIRNFDKHIGELQIKRDDLVRVGMNQFKRTEQQVLWDINRSNRNGKEKI